MKQLFICQSKAYATASAKATDLTTVPEGTIALFNHSDGALLTKAPTENFSIVVGRASGKMPLVFPEVDAKSLKVTKASYEAGVKFTAKITIPTPEKGKVYTVVIVKKGTTFNERSNWSFTAVAKNATAANVALEIVTRINANKEHLGVTATNSAGTITITAVDMGTDYEVVGADELAGVAPTAVTNGKKPVCDKAYIQDLASRCAAGKGFNYTEGEGKEIYPGYPEPVTAEQYVLYTLSFAVPRVSGKTRDEVVNQVVHIALPVGAGAITNLDTIFGLTEAAKA